MNTAVGRFATILLAVGLVGCVSDAKQVAPTSVAPQILTPQVATASPAAAPLPRPPARRPEPRVASGAVKSAAIPELDPNSLVGKSREQTRDLLGEPSMVRDDRPATVWQFDATGCRLEVFFYMDLKERDFRALSYGVSADGKPATGPEAAGCIGRIKAKHDERLTG